MEKTEKVTNEELNFLTDHLETLNERFLKFVGIIALVISVPLFVPISLLKFFSRKARNHTYNSEFLFIELGPMNVLYFLIIPAIVVIILCYIFLFRIPKLKKDIKEEQKLVGIVNVKEIKKLDDGLVKELMGSSDHKIVFHSNNFDEDEILFLSNVNPEYFNLKGCKIEVSKNAKILLKREVFYS